MKKLTLTLLTALLLVGFGNAATTQNTQNVPYKILSYITTHFPKNPIVEMERDTDGRFKYEIELRDGTELEFDYRMNVIEIESGSDDTPLPDSVVPTNILNFVKANYPDNFIIKLEWEKDGYEVELNNDIELEFDRKGKFIGIDD